MLSTSSIVLNMRSVSKIATLNKCALRIYKLNGACAVQKKLGK
jgi:hypothetical protein